MPSDDEPRRQPSLFSPEQMPERPERWEAAAERDRTVAQVVFNRPLETPYSYLVPEELRDLVGPGHRVFAPFGRGDRRTVGYVVETLPYADLPPRTRALKSLEAALDREPLVSPEMLDLTKWIAEHTLCGWGQVLHFVVPSGVKKKAGTRVVRFFRAAADVCGRRDALDLPAKQRAVLDALCGATEPLTVDELTERAGCGTGPVEALRRKGLIHAVRERSDATAPEADLRPIEPPPNLHLNADQERALAEIHAVIRAGAHRTILLHGVTGSGKTEVYIQAIQEIVSYGRQAIVLVPEISLTPQTIRRFRSRFDSVAVLHSHLSDAERHWHWQQIARGAVQVVVGARSAVFAPVPQLGLIVIDEEHETSFKQDTVPRYHARDVARRRTETASVPLILGSATPTLESWQRVESRQDQLASLPVRVAGRRMPPVVIVDVRNDPYCSRGTAIGRALDTAIRTTLEEGGQAILFQNLRGYSPSMWCRNCGAAIKCPHCDVSLTWHRDRGIALCHVCDHRTEPPRDCPTCRKPGLRYLGIGTQKLEEEVRQRYPDAPCLRMDSDTMRGVGAHDRALEAFRRGEARILLGTQMIAKGLDFAEVTLVGVIDADTILHQPDFRATERTHQLISQVAGRTGRGPKGGRVFVQTCSPTEPAIQSAARHDFVGFARNELKHRAEMGYPPFRHLTRVILRGPVEEPVRDVARAFAARFAVEIEKLALPVKVLGPAPCPVARLQANYRYHLQLSAVDLDPIRTLWRAVAADLPSAPDVEHVIDVDPLNMR